MWIVRLALSRPYTFVVGALLVVILGTLSVARTPNDVFPEIDIPVVSLIWRYEGLPPEEMERRVTTISERAITTTVNDVEHIESQSLNGIAVVKVFFHQGASVDAAVAQLSAIANTIVRVMPPGMQPPLIIRFNASSVPVLQEALSSDSLSEQALYDYGTNFIRTRLATVQGAAVPLPYGGRARLINVDLQPQQLYARGISPAEVSSAINAQSLVLPSGTAKIGDREYYVRMNGSPDALDALNDLPIKQVNGATVRIRDVAQVRDGYSPQTNIVRRDGHRGALITILKSGNASTLDVVSQVKAVLHGIVASLPSSLHVSPLADQSLFVRASLNGVLREAIIAALLTAAMILLFLGSWRSTLVVALSIPLSILTSLIVLGAIGQTINIMTLGGLALAVGVLVDDATVGIENIHRHLDEGKEIDQAIVDGAAQIAVPTFVSTLAICIVFVPIFFLTGVAASLFAPLAMAVIFAMLASYVISRTLVPTLIRYVFRYEARHADRAPGLLERAHVRFDEAFERLRLRYRAALTWAVMHRRRVGTMTAGAVLASAVLVPFVGEDFFPQVDAGSIRFHLRAPPGTRVEQTERIVADVERTVRQVIPASDLQMILDNVGISGSGGSNLAFSDNPTIGVTDADVLLALRPDRRGSTREYVRALRGAIRDQHPEVTLFFEPADIVGQILNFGIPAPIDVQVVGQNKPANYEVAKAIEREVKTIPGATDVYVHQVMNAPELFFDVDRDRASQLALTERDVAQNLLVSLSGSGSTAPNFWLNPQNGVSYQVAVQTPQYDVASVADINETPIVSQSGSASNAPPQVLANLTNMERRSTLGVVSHYNVQPVFDVFAGVQDRDLGGVARDVDRVVERARKTLPKGSTIVVRGQVASMRTSFAGLAAGLVLAVVLVYLLMVVNFQSWLDPFIIITALPGAVVGIVWMLFATQTTLNVPSLMGAIMSIGVATANSILLVSFANERRAAGLTAAEAAIEAGFVRLRPVLMTALAMIIGMLPMALGLGEGGEQNAPLGRAVIGGLTIATVATLFFVPVVYSVLRSRQPAPLVSQDVA